MTRRLPPRRPAAPTPVLIWEADLAPVAITLGDDPSARPALLLIVDVTNGLILAGDLVSHPSAQPAQIAATIADGIRAAIASTGTSPEILRVRHEKVADELSALLGSSGIAVERANELADVDAALAGFDETIVGHPPDGGLRTRASQPQTWAGWELDGEQIRRLFTAAAVYYRAAPWSNITNEDIVRAKVRGGGAWSATVMGMAGELFGLALYARHEDLLSILGGGRDLRGSVFSFSYSRRNEIPREMHTEVRMARWDVAGPTAYPSLTAINTPGGGITAREMEDVIAVIDAIPRFSQAHEPMLAGIEAQRYPIRWKDSASGVSIVFEGAPGRLG